MDKEPSRPAAARPGPLALVALVALVAPVAAFTAACATEIPFANVLPRVTWVFAAPPAEGAVDLTVWVHDYDGDPVDLEITWSAAGQDPAVGVAIVQAPGGHGVVGLTTRDAGLDPAGQPHLVRWDVGAVGDAVVALSFVPDDREAGEGARVVTPAFTLADGMDAPVAVVPAP